MKLMFYLSGENIEIAKEEVLAVAHAREYKLYGNILIVRAKPFEFKRLGFTHKVLKLIFISGIKDVNKALQKVSWKRHYEKDFCVRTHFDKDEKALAEIVWKKLKDPKVKLIDSSTQIELFKEGNKVFCGILLEENEKGYNKRSPHLRPGFHPSSMKPKLARACVNLSGVKKGGKVYDPFCGTGGILIEAAMIGCKVIGSDINEGMLKKTEKNFQEYNIKKYKLFQADATKGSVGCDVIVTDPPYGKSSSLYNQENLYDKFLENAYFFMRKGQRLVIVLPSKVKFNTKFKIIKTVNQYIHNTLTRNIYVLEKGN